MVAAGSGQLVQSFRIWTSHGTELAADAESGVLAHMAPGIGAAVVAQAVSPGAVLLARLDGGLFTCVASPGEAILAYPLLFDQRADGQATVVRLPGRRVLTAVPDGGLMADREVAGGWESFMLEAVAEAAPALLMLGQPGAAAEASRNPAGDPGVLAGLLAAAPAAERRSLMPAIAERWDYPAVFPLLRAMLSGGTERSEWHTQDHLRAGIRAHGWLVGDHTYGTPLVVDGQYGRLSIGRYCSIGGDVRIVVSNHATDTATTYPFAALHALWPSVPDGVADHVGRGVSIGHSVWIGTGATILPGARIGDGAIIGAMAVVAGTVPPYSVAVGNPARVVRQRFDPVTSERLAATQWWDWPDHMVDRAIPLLLGGDVKAFLEQAHSWRAAKALPP